MVPSTSQLSSLGKRKSEANSKVMSAELVYRPMLGTYDQTKLSVAYTEETPSVFFIQARWDVLGEGILGQFRANFAI